MKRETITRSMIGVKMGWRPSFDNAGIGRYMAMEPDLGTLKGKTLFLPDFSLWPQHWNINCKHARHCPFVKSTKAWPPIIFLHLYFLAFWRAAGHWYQPNELQNATPLNHSDLFPLPRSMVKIVGFGLCFSACQWDFAFALASANSAFWE